jgi:hypothetical protein
MPLAEANQEADCLPGERRREGSRLPGLRRLLSFRVDQAAQVRRLLHHGRHIRRGRTEGQLDEQAAKKAKEYVDYSSFSHSGLIKQLKYEGFTAAQATYGAKKVGL